MRFLVAGILLLTACKNDSTKGFEALADKACACPQEDAACGNKVLSEVVSFSADHKLADGDQERITAAGKRLHECVSMTGLQQTEITAALERFR